MAKAPEKSAQSQRERFIEAARQAGVLTFVGFNYRWAPVVQYARKLMLSTVVELMTLVTLGLRPSLHAAAKQARVVRRVFMRLLQAAPMYNRVTVINSVVTQVFTQSM